MALSLTAETESIDSEKWLFNYKLQEYKDNIPNLISRRPFNNRRKKTSGLCEELRKRIAMEMDGGEEQFFVDSKPIEVCRVARGKRAQGGLSVAGRCRCLTKDSNTSIEKEGYIPYSLQA